MHCLHTIKETRDALNNARIEGKTIGFVPTMGNLHSGHLKLIETARENADYVAASIFVNPMQFGPNEDFDAYPRTLERDSGQLIKQGADLLFAPSATEMYPFGLDDQIRVGTPDIANVLCGANRPGHFGGVTTVVCKLFNIIQPDIAVFGEKDYQQLAIVRKMVADLCMPIDIIPMPTVRESSGLALSSRNGNLRPTDAEIAPLLHLNLNIYKNKIITGQRNYVELEREATEKLEESGFEVDYFSICDQRSLKKASADQQDLVILVAAKLGTVRLIDNIAFSV
ncbi:MAG: pantoate--beta-alanine ligase [Pseudomonadales bacterium]|nr:pantoate--beta-alanine ligase [Pseudomonadales bacterium]